MKSQKQYICGRNDYSHYTYIEAFINEQQRLDGNVHMLEFFGGVTKIIVPDNTATAVNRKQSDWYTPELNATYREWQVLQYGDYPARVRRPGQTKCRGSVRHASTWIIAALRNEQFFSLSELNQAIKEKLKIYNSKDYQKREGSRLSLFLGEEKPPWHHYLLPVTNWQALKYRSFNYHSSRKMYYLCLISISKKGRCSTYR